MTYMLDTNICIYAIKHKPEQILKQLYVHLEDGMCISSITLAELAHGVRKSLYPEKNEEALLQFLSILDILDFDDLAAMEYGKICAHLQRQGRPIGAMEMLIAAHAKSEDLILVTNNLREFKRIPQLKLENWAK